MAKIIFVGESELQITEEDYGMFKNRFIIYDDCPKYICLADGTLVNTDNILCIEG